MQPTTPISRTFIVNVAAGLDVLRATIIVRALFPTESVVVAEANEDRVDGKSVLALCRLAAACGTEIRFSASGPDARRAITAVDALFATRFQTAPALPSAPQPGRREGPLGIKIGCGTRL
jgi:phosphotransferase system HPr (HPr) family protein